MKNADQILKLANKFEKIAIKPKLIDITSDEIIKDMDEKHPNRQIPPIGGYEGINQEVIDLTRDNRLEAYDEFDKSLMDLLNKSKSQMKELDNSEHKLKKKKISNDK